MTTVGVVYANVKDSRFCEMSRVYAHNVILLFAKLNDKITKNKSKLMNIVECYQLTIN